MICADELDVNEIVMGQYLTTNKAKYEVMSELGRGGYGCVFRVQRIPSDGSEFALKVEKRRAVRSKLTMEMKIMSDIGRQKPAMRTHFIEVCDRAKKDKFLFIVMTLVGSSLADLKRERNPPTFSLSTTYMTTLQCLEAIEQLHAVNFIHRDIKPGNYAIGLGAELRTIYILDFGIARLVVNKKSEIKAPRVKVAFKGTLRYAAVNCHRGQELGKKDDCESCLYLMADISNPDGLPWKGEKEREKVLHCKMRARLPDGAERTFRSLHVDKTREMLLYLDQLAYSDAVDYGFLYTMMTESARELDTELHGPYDWELEAGADGTLSRSSTTTMSIQKTQMNLGKPV